MNLSHIAVTSRSFSQNPVLRQALLAQYPAAKLNDAGLQLKGDVLIEFLQPCDGVIAGLEKFDDKTLRCLPQLKVISRFGVGLDSLDLVVMETYGVRLGFSPGVNKRSISELVIALAISLLRKVHVLVAEVKGGAWRQIVGNQLSGRTLGIIGFGSIGRDLAGLARAFGCTIIAYDEICQPTVCAQLGVAAVSLVDLLKTADVVTLHLPLTEKTQNLLNEERLSLLKPSAILINMARGCLVDELVLKKKLKEGSLAGAAFDVFAVEPPVDQELLQLPNFLATPHIGGSSEEAIVAMGKAAIEGLQTARLPSEIFGVLNKEVIV